MGDTVPKSDDEVPFPDPAPRERDKNAALGDALKVGRLSNRKIERIERDEENAQWLIFFA